MITQRQAIKLHRLIRNHVQAQIDLSWIGSKTDAEERTDIKTDVIEASLTLADYVTSLTEQKK